MITALEDQKMIKAAEAVCDDVWKFVLSWSEFARDTVGKQLAFEKLVTDISTRIARMPIEDVDEEIVRSLQRIVEFLEVERSSLGEFSSEDGLLLVSHSYALPGFDPMPRVNVDQQFPWYAARLRRGEIVRFER